MAGSNTYFLDVSGHVSLTVATKGSFRGKEILKFNIFMAFFKQKSKGAPKINEVFLTILEC